MWFKQCRDQGLPLGLLRGRFDQCVWRRPRWQGACARIYHRRQPWLWFRRCVSRLVTTCDLVRLADLPLGCAPHFRGLGQIEALHRRHFDSVEHGARFLPHLHHDRGDADLSLRILRLCLRRRVPTRTNDEAALRRTGDRRERGSLGDRPRGRRAGARLLGRAGDLQQRALLRVVVALSSRWVHRALLPQSPEIPLGLRSHWVVAAPRAHRGKVRSHSALPRTRSEGRCGVAHELDG
mmetsp:Transcript_118741/g.378671  ORF Transcript_118741/g.378671 Transcript_118741/m.378671 type:complete len:237 (-) Transcript_118741:1273-1983(-)